jgi:hypothetical protein
MDPVFFIVIGALIPVGVVAAARAAGARWINIALYVAVGSLAVVGSLLLVREVIRTEPVDPASSVSNAPGP